MNEPAKPAGEAVTIANRVLPDLQICRARGATEKLAVCLVSSPSDCRYALSFGNAYFCTHPEWAEILAKTVAAPG